MVQAALSGERLREHLKQQIGRMTEEQLLRMYQVVAQLYGEELSEKITQDWEHGQVSQEKIEAAIREHRVRYPYGPSPSTSETDMSE